MNLSKVIILQLTCFCSRCKRSGILLIIALLYVPVFVDQAQAQRAGNAGNFDQKPSVVWTFSCAAPIVSSPVEDAGLVYFGAEDSTWYALELNTGKVKWKLRTNAPIRASPVVHGDRVLLAGGNGVLASVNKFSGTVAWRIVFDETAVFMGERNYDFADYFHSTPSVDNNVIYMASGNGIVAAYEAGRGTPLWRYDVGEMVHSRPVVVRDKVIFGCFDGNVYALNKESGRLAWKFKTVGHRFFPRGEVQGFLGTDGQRVFVGARDFNFYAIDAASGTASWNLAFPNGWAMGVTVSDTVVYIGTSDDRIMVAADVRTGRELWRTDVKLNVFGGCAVSQSTIVFGTIWGKAFALDRATGTVKWTFDTDGYRKHRLKYFDQDDRFRPDIDNILRSPFAWIAAEHLMGGIFSTPVMSGNMIVITSTEGKVYALR